MKRCRSIGLMFFLALGFALLTGCGDLDKVKETTIAVTAKGAVTEVIVDSEKEKAYTAEELQAFVEEDIKAFNQDAKSEHVKLKSCEIKEDETRIEIKYDSYTDYAAYHKTELFCGTIKEAQDAGYKFDTEFKDNNGETAAFATIMANDSQWQVVILEEPIQVMVDGTILYASADVEISSKKEAKIAAKGDGDEITTESLIYLIYK